MTPTQKQNRTIEQRAEVIDDGGLHDRLKEGLGVTLVVGAGINKERGLPLWPELLRKAWTVVFQDDAFGRREELLRKAKAACLSAGIPPHFVERLDAPQHPFELQFAFEDILEVIREPSDRDSFLKLLKLRPRKPRRGTAPPSQEQWALQTFADLLRKELYRNESPSGRRAPDTLSLVADAIRFSARREFHRRLIRQVITFNVDDLLERVVNSRGATARAFPIVSSSSLGALPDRETLPVFHVHGFLPRRRNDYEALLDDGSSIPGTEAPLESLVFTDEQYWRSIDHNVGFASRVFSNALIGNCVFLGVSMKDLNLIRWLAQDARERFQDLRRLMADWEDPWEAFSGMIEGYQRHFWITTDDLQSPSNREREPDVVRNTLSRRGVVQIAIPAWDSEEFAALWRTCFLPRSNAKRRAGRRS